MTDPRTPQEWQEAVEWAETCLLLDSARPYGLVSGGPEINIERCLELLARGKARGHQPTTAGTDACLVALAEGSGLRHRRRRASR